MSGGRRALVCCVLLVCSLVAPAGVSAQSEPVSFGVAGPDAVSAGETVTLNVTVRSQTPVYAASFELSVAGGRALSVERGPFLGDDVLVLEGSADGGTATFGATRAGVDDGVTGSGTVAQVRVAVPADASGPLSVSFNETGVADPSATEVETTGAGLDIPLAGSGSDGSNESDGAGSGGVGSIGGDTGSGDSGATADVSDELAAAAGSTPVVVQVAEGTSLDTVARALRANGARRTYTLPGAHAVGGQIDAGTAGTLAGIEGVASLRTAAEVAPTGTAQVSADGIGAGRARASVDVPDSVPRVAVSLPDLGGSVAPERIAFDATGPNGTLTVAASGVPADAPAFDRTSLGGFTVAHPGIEASNVSVRFAVEADADATLYRLDGSWTALPTERAGGSYRATAPGLSAFIAGSNGTDGSTTMGESSATTAGSADGNGTATTTASGGTPGFTALVALLVLLASVALAARGTRKK